jgi:hypothetical protein
MAFTVLSRAPRSTQIDLKAKELWQNEVTIADCCAGSMVGDA